MPSALDTQELKPAIENRALNALKPKVSSNTIADEKFSNTILRKPRRKKLGDDLEVMKSNAACSKRTTVSKRLRAKSPGLLKKVKIMKGLP